MDLKREAITHAVVDYQDFEAWVNHHFNQTDYSFVAGEECGNDTDHEFQVTGTHFVAAGKPYAVGLSRFDQEEIDQFIAGTRKHGGSYLASGILEAGVVRGLIPAGHYLIRVCW